MGIETGIEWTDATVNFWVGCQKVSSGCKNCYMFSEQARYGGDPTTIRRCKEATFSAALKWQEPKKIFTCSWSDFFIKEADAWRSDAWDVIRRTPQHTWQILTKRPERIAQCLPPDWGNGWPNVWMGTSVENQAMADKRIPELLKVPATVRFLSCEPLLGPVDLSLSSAMPIYRVADTVTNYCGLSQRVISVAHNQHSINAGWRRHNGFRKATGDYNYVNWVICGGESGSEARPMHPHWARELRDQCAAAGVDFHFKQWGAWALRSEKPAHFSMREGDFGVLKPDGEWFLNATGWNTRDIDEDTGEAYVVRVGKKTAGRILDGVEHNAMPQTHGGVA